MSLNKKPPDRRTLARFFDAIAFRYDFLNTLLSLGRDESWRRRSAVLSLKGNETSVLELGVGTGKFLSEYLARHAFQCAAGVDFSLPMLTRARKRLAGAVRLTNADFHALPFRGESFDLILASFILRSVRDLSVFFQSIHGLLRPEGRVIFLCLTRPSSPFLRAFFSGYVRWGIPLFGKWLTSNPEAYHFLSDSVQTFQSPEKTAEMLRACGFPRVEIQSFTFGVATFIMAEK